MGRRRRDPLVAAWAAFLLGAGALTSCSSAEPLPAVDAVAHYQGVGTSVTDALGDFGGPWTYQETSRRVEETGGDCLYSAGQWEGSGPLAGVSGADGWDAVDAALGDTVQKAGFGSFSAAQRQGAMHVIEATDAHGATLRIDEQGGVRISGARVDATPCTEAGLGL